MEDKYELQTNFVSCGCIGDTFYLHNFLDGTLMHMDKNTGKMKFLNAPMKDAVFGAALNYLYADGCMYMVQKDLKYLMCYDTAEDKAEYWELPCTFYTPTRPNGSLSTIYDEEIYVFPIFDKNIYIFNLKEKKIVRKIEMQLDAEVTAVPYDEKVEKEYIKPRKAIFRKGLRVENYAWLFPESGCEIIRFSMKTGEIKKYLLPEHDSAYLDVCHYDGKFYLLNGTGRLSAWTPDGKMETLWGDKGNTGAYMRVIVTDVNIWLLPNRDSEIVVFDRGTAKFSACPFYPDGFEYREFIPGQSLFYLGCDDEDWYYLSMCAQSDMLWINKHTGRPHWLRPQAPTMAERFVYQLQKDKVLIEQNKGLCTLDNLLASIKEKAVEIRSQDSNEVGKFIYENVTGGKIGENLQTCT